MPELNDQQFPQGQLFETSNDSLPPHQMRREQFMRDPKTQFHSMKATFESRAKGEEDYPDWDPESENPLHTGTTAAALARADQYNPPVFAVQPVGEQQTEVRDDYQANQFESQLKNNMYDAEMVKSAPYINDVEDRGSTSFVHPTTKYHVKRHEDFVSEAEKKGEHVPTVVSEEAKLARSSTPRANDIRAEFSQLDWPNKGQNPVSKNPANRRYMTDKIIPDYKMFGDEPDPEGMAEIVSWDVWDDMEKQEGGYVPYRGGR